MYSFEKRLAEAMIQAGWIKKDIAWFEGKNHADITRYLTQSELAEAIGISNTTISKHLSGSQKPHIDDLRSYSKMLNVSIDWLLENGNDTETKPSSSLVKYKEKHKQQNLYVSAEECLQYSGFEANTHYIDTFKDLFCIATVNTHYQDAETNKLMRLFYLDYLLFLMIVASASSLAQDTYFENNFNRNLQILNNLFILLPHKLNDKVDKKLQRYVISLLEVEVKQNTRRSIEGVFSIVGLAFFWLQQNQSFQMILALKIPGSLTVINFINSFISDHNLAIEPIGSDVDQQKLIARREINRQTIMQHLQKRTNSTA